ncbi:ParA family protein [Methylovulum psychrotolerans]|uniref:ParA family protein n=1 Tax=Methylovulum psychrotolerans TaxID=1704499 RepID=UPI001BFEF3E8|nr:ParA family protein [Methylovulum psychrotolerans]MBT9100581.1 ParA family protein [Methylovulum psychrotolerans]
MKTIVVTSQKGGSGKTTLCAHLAVEAERMGDCPVWLIDTDKQGTLSVWHERRNAETPQRAEISLTQIEKGLTALANRGAKYCFIDTPPTISEQNVTVLKLADLVVIPVRPSPADLWAVSHTVALAQEEGKPFLFVITQSKANANITAQTVAALSHHGRVAKTFIADRVHYAAAMTDGRSAPELANKGQAAQEIAGLWQDIKSCFNENNNSLNK